MLKVAHRDDAVNAYMVLANAEKSKRGYIMEMVPPNPSLHKRGVGHDVYHGVVQTISWWVAATMSAVELLPKLFAVATSLNWTTR